MAWEGQGRAPQIKEPRLALRGRQAGLLLLRGSLPVVGLADYGAGSCCDARCDSGSGGCGGPSLIRADGFHCRCRASGKWTAR